MARNDYGVVFNGRRIVHPGAYDAIESNGLTAVSDGSLDLPIVVGTADSGEKGVLKWFSSVDVAREYLGGGDLVAALELMFSPSPQGGGGASVIGVIVANDARQANATIGGISFTALKSGDAGNRTTVKVEDGVVAGTKLITVQRWDLESMEVYANLGALFSVKYTGTSAYATMGVTNGVLTTKVGADAGSAVTDVSLNLLSGQYATVGDAIAYFSGISDYEVTLSNYNNLDMTLTKVDNVTSSTIKGVAKHVLAVESDIEHQISKISNLVSADITGAITNAPTTNLAGGTKGATPSSWVSYFDTIKKNFSDILVVLSSDPGIHAEAMAHVSQMENRNQKQMLFTGGGIGESVAQVKQRAMQLNSSRAVLGYPACYHKAYNDGKIALPAYMTGAMIAGRVAGVDPAEPITGDYFNLISLENDLVAGDPDIDDLITSGIATLERVGNGGIRLVQGITTYLGANNSLYREISVRRGADNISSTMRQTMENTFVGQKMPATPSAVQTKAIDVLEEAVRNQEIAGYQNIKVAFQGTVVVVSYEVAPIEPINFVLITSHFIPASSLTTNTEQ
jgi:hypothetical protein